LALDSKKPTNYLALEANTINYLAFEVNTANYSALNAETQAITLP